MSRARRSFGATAAGIGFALAMATRIAHTADIPELRVGQAGLRVLMTLQSGIPADIGAAGLLEWVQRSANIVAGYFGGFPVRFVNIDIDVTEGERMGGGQTFGYPQPHIHVSVGRHIAAAALIDDWVLVHEMTHLALPDLDAAQDWLAEGVATYVEGVARTQAGNMTDIALWGEYVRAMPKGLPEPGDLGLDRTHTWARTYWGGALFCLLADVRIHEHTANRRGLQDALRAIASTGSGMSTRWPIERVLDVGDAATGTHDLTALYRSMKSQSMAPDLDALWTDLGIRGSGATLHFDNSARLADTRRAITRR